jgi:hypothetical protein
MITGQYKACKPTQGLSYQGEIDTSYRINCNYPPMHNYECIVWRNHERSVRPAPRVAAVKYPDKNSLKIDFLDRLGRLAAGGEEPPRVGQEMLIQCMSRIDLRKT